MMTFIGWIFFSVAAAMFASHRRNRNAGGWFFVAVFFTPLVAFVLLAILQPLPLAQLPTPANDRGISDERRTSIEAAVLTIGVALILAMGWMAIGHAQQSRQQVFRDASGRTVGTATTDSAGTTVFRDAGGRTTGTATAPRRR
jgi:hypothetical protein